MEKQCSIFYLTKEAVVNKEAHGHPNRVYFLM